MKPLKLGHQLKNGEQQEEDSESDDTEETMECQSTTRSREIGK